MTPSTLALVLILNALGSIAAVIIGVWWYNRCFFKKLRQVLKEKNEKTRPRRG